MFSFLFLFPLLLRMSPLLFASSLCFLWASWFQLTFDHLPATTNDKRKSRDEVQTEEPFDGGRVGRLLLVPASWREEEKKDEKCRLVWVRGLISWQEVRRMTLHSLQGHRADSYVTCGSRSFHLLFWRLLPGVGVDRDASSRWAAILWRVSRQDERL